MIKQYIIDRFYNFDNYDNSDEYRQLCVDICRYVDELVTMKIVYKENTCSIHSVCDRYINRLVEHEQRITEEGKNE